MKITILWMSIWAYIWAYTIVASQQDVLIIKRTPHGDMYRYQSENKIKQCKTHKTLTSTNNGGIICSDYRDVAVCNFGYVESNVTISSSVTVTNHKCFGGVSIENIGVWDTYRSRGIWKSLNKDDVLPYMVEGEDTRITFKVSKDISWSGNLLKVSMKCGVITDCIIIKFYGTNNYPLPRDKALQTRELAQLNSGLALTTKEDILTTIQTTSTIPINVQSDDNIIKKKNNTVMRTKHHVEFLNILYCILLAIICSIVLCFMVYIIKRNKRSIYNVSKMMKHHRIFQRNHAKKDATQLMQITVRHLDDTDQLSFKEELIVQLKDKNSFKS